MPDTTNNLGLPYLLPNQAQKHVTMNEALERLDATVQITLNDDDVSAPPENPADGLRLLVGATPTGIFSEHAGKIAAFNSGSWIFIRPMLGWLAWFVADASLKVFDGTVWQPISAGASGAADQLARLGINTAPDDNNQLTVRGEASLFNHADSDHRLTINKAEAADTASLVLQTGFEGHAEIGLTGNDDLSVRVRESGADWTTALDISSDTGITTARGLRSGRVLIETQGVVSLPTPEAGGFVCLTIVSENFPRIEYSGIFVYDTGVSPLVLPIALGPRASAQGATVLTGTTGPDDSMNVAATNGALMIENRYRSTRSFNYTFLC